MPFDQLGLFDASAFSRPQPAALRYFSGCGAPAIFDGYADAGAPMCVAVAGLSPSMQDRLAGYVKGGGDVLLDSGAYVHRGDPGSLDWRAVLKVYEAMAAAGHCKAVLPDVVGDQGRTLELLSEHSATLRALRGRLTLLLPVQGGPMPLDQFCEAAGNRLGFEPDGLAVPSAAAALPEHRLAELEGVGFEVSYIHFLGVSRNSTLLRRRISALERVFPAAVFSSDACEHRALVGQGRRLTIERRDLVPGCLEQLIECHDDTESDVDGERQEIRALFPHLGDDEIEDVLCSGWGREVSWNRARTAMERKAGAMATRAVIGRFASERGGLASRNGEGTL